MSRTIKDATVKHYHYDSHDQLRQHVKLFIDAYNHGRRLKTLRGLILTNMSLLSRQNLHLFKSIRTATLRDQTQSFKARCCGRPVSKLLPP